MTVRVERTLELEVPPEEVWEFIADPRRRAEAISLVADYEARTETEAVWHVKLPVIGRTVAVETRDVERDPPRYVRFVGRSKVLDVVGEHEVSATETGSRLVNRFVVEGRLPGVERFFERNLDGELDNLEARLREVTGA